MFTIYDVQTYIFIKNLTKLRLNLNSLRNQRSCSYNYLNVFSILTDFHNNNYLLIKINTYELFNLQNSVVKQSTAKK